MTRNFRGVAQLVEHWSPKPGVAGSSPVSPANVKSPGRRFGLFTLVEAASGRDGE